MSTPHDELYCRLAIRKGALSKEDATALLRAYRNEGKSAEGIREFSVNEGYLEGAAAGQLEKAIAQRASGHVDETLRKVPKLNKAASGKTHATHHRHHHHGPVRKKTTPVQATIFGIGALVLIGAVVMLMMELTSGNRGSPAKSIAGDGEKGGVKQPEKVATFDSGKPKTAEEKNYSKEEIKNLKIRVDLAITTSRQDMSDGNYARAVSHLKAKKRELGGDLLPSEMLTEFDLEIKGVQSILAERYAELVVELKTAKESGEEADVQAVLQEIEDTCGVENRNKAEGKAPPEDAKEAPAESSGKGS